MDARNRRDQVQRAIHPISCTPRTARTFFVSAELVRGSLTGAVRRIANRLRSGDRLGILRRAVSSVSRPGDRQRRQPVTPVFVSVFEGRNAPPLRPPFPGPNVIETPPRRACRCHAPRLAMSLLSGTHPFGKCSLVTSPRGAIYLCFSLATTRLVPSRQTSNSCTPPALRGRSAFRRSLQGAPVCAPSSETLSTFCPDHRRRPPASSGVSGP